MRLDPLRAAVALATLSAVSCFRAVEQPTARQDGGISIDGVRDDAGHGEPQSPDAGQPVSGSPAPADASVGTPADASVGTPADASVGTPVDASVGPSSEQCPSEYPDITYDGLVGSATCPAAGSVAFLLYGQNIPLPCYRFMGPEEQTPVGMLRQCNYTLDETECEDGGTSSWAIELPYFGEGTANAPLPSEVVTSLESLCDGPHGAVHPVHEITERAQLTLGVWLRCTGDDPYNTRDGFVFFGDGSFQNVRLGPDGRVELVEGCHARGLWGYIPSSPERVDFFRASGRFTATPTFLDGTPRRMSFGMFSGGSVDLVHVP